MDYEARNRIPLGTQMMMVLVAVCFWIVAFIPIVNIFSDIVAWLIFWFWFKLRGASISRKWALNIGSALAELIPVVGTLISAFPYVIYRNIKAIQKEDAEYNASIEASIAEERRAAL